MSSPDRRVHAVTPLGNEIVRYERGGKWWVEGEDSREPVTLDGAVKMALAPGTDVRWGTAGGRQFEARLKKAQAAQK